MKIGILSLPMWNNYGGILQAYALQKVLERFAHEVEFINRHHPIPTALNEKMREIKRIIKTKVLNKKDLVIYPNYKEKKHISVNTLEFINAEIDPITNPIHSAQDLKNLNYQAMVVGSDQVWRPRYVPNIFNYYLDFASADTIKISYAASFGTDKWEYTTEETDKCGNLLNKFSSVSVREDSGVDLVKRKFDMGAEHTLDPTMLLKKDDYIQLIRKYEGETKSEGNLFTYILDQSSQNEDIVSIISERLGLKPFKVMPKVFDENFDFENEDYIFPRLTRWLKAFQDSEFVIADSFHGCVFSIIFNKPFIAIGNQERGLARFNSLLKMFNLENRLILQPSELTEELITSTIDWRSVNQILDAKKLASLSFLEKSLKQNI